MENSGRTNWGIMFLRLSRVVNLSGIVVFGLLFATSVQARPYTEAERASVESESEKKVRELSDKEFQELKVTLNRRKVENRDPQLYFRLLDLTIDLYRQGFLLEGRVHEKVGKLGEVVDRSYSHGLLKRGAELGEELVGTGRRFSDQDRLYSLLSYFYSELGNTDRSIFYLKKIIAQFPDSPYSLDAYRAIGDVSFEQKKYREAQIQYEKGLAAAGKNDPPPRLLYRLAWTYYRQKDYARAVDIMKRSVDVALKGGEKYLSVREEALRDLALFLSEQGGVENVIEYFTEKVGDKAYLSKVLEKLAQEYERTVQKARAAQVYEYLLKIQPSEEVRFRVETQLIFLDLKAGQIRKALDRLKTLVFPKSLSPADGTVSELDALYRSLKKAIRMEATTRHESHRKKANRSLLVEAVDIYELYLKKFTIEPKERAEILFYHADGLKELGRYADALTIYQTLSASQDPKLAKQAALLHLATLSEWIKKVGVQDPKLAIQLQKQFLESTSRVEEVAPESSDVPEALLRAAQVLAAESATRTDAAARCEKVVVKFSKTPQAITCAQLWLQLIGDSVIEKKSGAVDELKQVLATIRSRPELLKSSLVKQAVESREELRRMAEAEKIDQEKDPTVAGKAYEDYSASVSSPVESQKALNNALLSYIQAKKWDSVKQVAAELQTPARLKASPLTEKAKGNLLLAATALVIAGDFSGAYGILTGPAIRESSEKMSAQVKQAMNSVIQPQKLSAKYYAEREKFEATLKKAQALKIETLKPVLDKLNGQIERRLAVVEQLNRLYAPIVEQGGPFGVQALGEMARQVERLASEIQGVAKSDSFPAEAKSTLATVESKLMVTANASRTKAIELANVTELLTPEVAKIHHEREVSLDAKASRFAQGFRGRFRLASVTSASDVRDALHKAPKNAGLWVDYGNLLWKEGKLSGARLAYETALDIDSKLGAAWNNLGVLDLAGPFENDLGQAYSAQRAFKKAISFNSELAPAYLNLGLLYNYFHLFSIAARNLEKAMTLAKSDTLVIQEALVMAEQGMGDSISAQKRLDDQSEILKQTESLQVTIPFLKAAWAYQAGSAEQARVCLTQLNRLEIEQAKGFEVLAIQSLKQACEKRSQQ